MINQNQNNKQISVINERWGSIAIEGCHMICTNQTHQGVYCFKKNLSNQAVTMKAVRVERKPVQVEHSSATREHSDRYTGLKVQEFSHI